MKNFFKQIVPPFLWNLAKNIYYSSKKSSSIYWEGKYSTWEEALLESKGYADPQIADALLPAARKARDGACAYERDSVCFYVPQYNYHLLTAILFAAQKSRDKLTVLDFGGSLGSLYFQHRIFVDSIKNISWNVIEQPHIVTIGKSEFSIGNLHFLDDIYSLKDIDIVILSGVLQYIESPYDLLHKIIELNPKIIYLGRLQSSHAEDYLAVQHVPEYIYKASYPCWFLDRKKIETILSNKYSVLPWQHSSVDPDFFFETFAIRN